MGFCYYMANSNVKLVFPWDCKVSTLSYLDCICNDVEQVEPNSESCEWGKGKRNSNAIGFLFGVVYRTYMEEKRGTQNGGKEFALTYVILDGLVLPLKGNRFHWRQQWVRQKFFLRWDLNNNNLYAWNCNQWKHNVQIYMKIYYLIRC